MQFLVCARWRNKIPYYNIAIARTDRDYAMGQGQTTGLDFTCVVATKKNGPVLTGPLFGFRCDAVEVVQCCFDKVTLSYRAPHLTEWTARLGVMLRKCSDIRQCL